MTPAQAAEATTRAHARGVLVEVSGGINLDTAPRYAEVGVDIISAGALTHSAPAVDLALDVLDVIDVSGHRGANPAGAGP